MRPQASPIRDDLANRLNNLKQLDLIEIQKESWEKLLTAELKDILQEFFPIEDYTGKKFALYFEDFYFDIKGKYGTFTGFGSIYNHADDPNADYTINIKKRIASIKAIKTIHKGEE